MSKKNPTKVKGIWYELGKPLQPMVYHCLRPEQVQLYQIPKWLFDKWTALVVYQEDRANNGSGSGAYGCIAWFDEYIFNGIGITQYAINTGYIDIRRPYRNGKYTYVNATSANDPGLMTFKEDNKIWNCHGSDPLCNTDSGKPVSP